MWLQVQQSRGSGQDTAAGRPVLGRQLVPPTLQPDVLGMHLLLPARPCRAPLSTPGMGFTTQDFKTERDNWDLEVPPNQTFPSRRCSEPWTYGIRLRLSGMRQRTLGPPCSYASEDTKPHGVLTGSQPHSRQLPLWADYSGRETSALKGCSGSAPFPTALLTHTLWKPPCRG